MKTLWKVIAGILAAVFAVGLFVASCCTAAVWGLSGAFTEKKIAAALEKVELAQLLGMGESDAITQTLMKSDAMKGLVSEYAGGAVGYLRGDNKGDFALSASRKAALKEACMQVLKDSGISAQGGEAADSLEQVAGKMSDSLSASLPGYATVFSGINASTMSMLQGLLSVGARITFVVLMVLGCLLIMLVQWSPRRMLIWAGVP
ncbi:MAG: hypothetical protein PHD32_12240, partial [Eubacteriales bacterium]|nr:hypothetical protein [Eubacteriales bacterium]